MAFDYLSTSVNLFNLIFTEILKISPSLLYKYTTIQDQVLNLILVPHVILFLFIYSFSVGIVGRITGGHKGFSTLLGVVIYIYVIWTGWYGTFLIPLLNAWFIIALIFGLILFFITVIIHPARGPALVRLGAEAGKMLGGRMFENEKKIKKLTDELERLDRIIRENEHAARQGNPGAIQDLNNARYEYNKTLKKIERLEGD